MEALVSVHAQYFFSCLESGGVEKNDSILTKAIL